MVTTETYKFIRDNYFNDKTTSGYVMNGSKSYLHLFERDTDEIKKKKREVSTLYNFFRPLTDLFLSPIYARASFVELESSSEFLKNIFSESDIMLKASELLLDYKLYDKCFFATESEFDQINKREEQIDINISKTIDLPYISKILPEDVKQIRYKNNKQTEIKKAVYIEKVDYDLMKIPVEVSYEANIFTKRTLAWIVNGQVTLQEDKESTRIKEFDVITFGIFNKIGNSLLDQPRSVELCDLQREYFNLNSEVRDLQRKCSGAIFTLFTQDNPETITLGNDSALVISDENPKAPEYVQADSDAIGFYETTIENLKQHIYKINTLGLWNDNITYNSVMSSTLASKSFTNVVNEYYNVYKRIIRTLIGNYIYIYGTELNGVEYNLSIEDDLIQIIEDEIVQQSKDIIGIS